MLSLFLSIFTACKCNRSVAKCGECRWEMSVVGCIEGMAVHGTQVPRCRAQPGFGPSFPYEPCFQSHAYHSIHTIKLSWRKTSSHYLRNTIWYAHSCITLSWRHFHHGFQWEHGHTIQALRLAELWWFLLLYVQVGAPLSAPWMRNNLNAI